MEKLEFKADLNTPYIKIVRFLGAALFGFVVGSVVFTLKFEGTIDWMYSVSGIMCSLVFMAFPEIWKKQSLTIDEMGIYLHNYTFGNNQKREITWEEVKGIGVNGNSIEFKNNIGSTERINLPVYTKNQLKELRSYLKQMTDTKGLEYIK
ncbi:MAG: hypothetical protein FH748_03060 [Balneolaceae bacterium]|nr:hypothetical protein [Balneolaceae bacterium]